MKKTLFLIIIALGFYSCRSNTKTTPQTAYFSWEEGLCRYRGKYDANLYDSIILQNTLSLIYQGVALQTEATIFDYKDIHLLNLNTLEKEYAKRKSYLQNLKVPNNTYWKTMVKFRMQELESEYFLKKHAIQGYTNPSTLVGISQRCDDYAKALASENEIIILKAWKTMIEEQRQKNGGNYNFDAKYQSDNRIDHAKVDLLTFGWWNCVNNTINRPNEDQIMNETFKGFFTELIEECDKP